VLQVDDMTLADQDTAADVGGRGAQLPPVDLQLLLKEAASAGALAPLDLVLEKIEILQGVSDQARDVLKKVCINNLELGQPENKFHSNNCFH
jgi:hypothetical protein